MQDDNKEISGSYAIPHDMGTRSAEEQLRYQAGLLENVSDAIISTDSQYIIRTWNKGAEAVYGWPAEAVIGKIFPQVIPTTYLNETREQVLGQFHADGFWKGEVIQKRRDGASLHILSAASLLYDSVGTTTGAVVINRDITERKQVEEALRQSEERFRSIVINEPECVKTVSVAGILLDMNPAGLRMVEADRPDQVLNQPVVNLVHPGDHHAFNQLHHSVIQGESGQLTFRLKGLKGAKRWVETHSAPLRDRDGKVVSVLSVTRDITERKQAQEELEQSKMLLEIAGEAARLGGWIVDLSTDRVIWSDVVCAIHEVPPGSAPTIAEAIDYYPPEWRPKIQAVYEACLLDGKSFDEEMEILTANERRVWVRVIGRAVRNAEGTITRVQGAFQDISQQKETEASLIRSERRFRQLADAMPLIVWTAEPDGTVDYANQALDNFTGVIDLDLPAQRWLEVLHPEDRDRCLATWEQSVHTGAVYTIDFRIRRHDGLYRWHMVQATAIRDSAGEILKWYGTAADVHDRRLMEEETRRLANHLTAALASIADGFMMLDHEWRFTYINPAAEQLLQRPQAELVGQVIWDEFQEAVSSVFYHEYHRAVRENLLVVYEAYYPPLATWFAVRAYPSDKGLAIHFHDITERKQHEREQEAEAIINTILRATISRSDILTVVLDQVLTLLPADGALFALYNPDNEMIVEAAQGIFSHSTGLRLTADEDILGRVISSGRVFMSNDMAQETSNAPPNLFEGAAAAACAPLMVHDQTIGLLWIGRQSKIEVVDVNLLTAIAGIAANAIHRAALFEKTQAQAEQIAQIMHSVPDGVLLLDGQHQLLLANPAAQAYLTLLGGAEEGDILTHLGDLPLERLLRPLPAGQWHETQAGKHTFEVGGRLLATAPTPAGWVLVLRDVTEQRLVQRRLQVQERLAAVGQLAAGIAHDFNNLLSVIVLYSQLIAGSSGISERDKKRLITINQQAERAAQMIQQILDFSRRSILERQPLDLIPLFKQQIKLLQHTLPENIEIEWLSTAGECLVEADPTHIQQVIMNLGVNARDAMPQGGHLTFGLDRIHLTGQSAPPIPGMAAGHWIRLTVTDTGSGIPAENLDHIFEPFFTTKEPGKGTGLGLAQVHGIVAQHGGQVSVTSEVTKGSMFTIYLPALAVAPKPALVDEPVALPQGQGERLLVVEDNDMLRAALISFLQAWNYQTVEAANGEEALNYLTAQAPEVALVISDVVMPRMGGVALFHEMQQRGWSIPFILMSGHPLEEDTTRLRKQGLHTWLPKPPNLVLLAEAIATALSGN